MAESRILETNVYSKQTKYNNSRMRIFRFFHCLVFLSLLLRIFISFRIIYLFISLISIFCRIFLPCNSLERANQSIKLLVAVTSASIVSDSRKERKVGVRVPFASRYYSPESGIRVIDAPSSTLSSMVWIFRRPSLEHRPYPCNELDRVCSLLVLRSIDINRR